MEMSQTKIKFEILLQHFCGFDVMIDATVLIHTAMKTCNEMYLYIFDCFIRNYDIYKLISEMHALTDFIIVVKISVELFDWLRNISNG